MSVEDSLHGEGCSVSGGGSGRIRPTSQSIGWDPNDRRRVSERLCECVSLAKT